VEVQLEHREFARRAEEPRSVDPKPTFESLLRVTGVPVETLVHFAGALDLGRWRGTARGGAAGTRRADHGPEEDEDWDRVAGIIDWLESGV